MIEAEDVGVDSIAVEVEEAMIQDEAVVEANPSRIRTRTNSMKTQDSTTIMTYAPCCFGSAC